MCADTHAYNSIKPGCKWATGRGGFREMELLLWMGPHQRKRVETVLSSDLKWNTPFSWHRVSMFPPLILGPQHACTVSCGRGVRALILRLAGNSISCERVCHGSEAWTLSSWHGYLAVKYSVSKGPPPPRYTCCHHLSMARRHSLSQQMRGLSERAPQFLRDCGEEGGSRHARLWFLPTVLLLVQAGPDHCALAVTHLASWTWEGEWPVLYRVVVFLAVS